MTIRNLSATLFLIFLSGCSAGDLPRPSIPFEVWPHAPSASKAVIPAHVALCTQDASAWATINHKAYAIAQAVAREHKDFLLAMDGRLVHQAMIAFVPEKEGAKFESILLAKKETDPADVFKACGVAYTFAMTKRGDDIGEEDFQGAVISIAKVFALSAHYLLAAQAPKEFFFVDATVFLSSISPHQGLIAQRDVDIPAFHASVEDMLAEKAKGEEANWVEFIGQHANPRYPYVMPVAN